MTDEGKAALTAAGVQVEEALNRFMGNEALLERLLKKVSGRPPITASCSGPWRRTTRKRPSGRRTC